MSDVLDAAQDQLENNYCWNQISSWKASGQKTKEAVNKCLHHSVLDLHLIHRTSKTERSFIVSLEGTIFCQPSFCSFSGEAGWGCRRLKGQGGVEDLWSWTEALPFGTVMANHLITFSSRLLRSQLTASRWHQRSGAGCNPFNSASGWVGVVKKTGGTREEEEKMERREQAKLEVH